MNDIDKPRSGRGGRTSIGAAAARKRDELGQFLQAEQRRQQAYRQEKEQRERALSQLESQARQGLRAQHLVDKKRVCYLLGELLLNALQAQGMAALHISRAHLDQLQPAALFLVGEVLDRCQGAPVQRALAPLIITGSESDLDDVPF